MNPPTTATAPFCYAVDQPGPVQAPNGTLTLSGWLILGTDLPPRVRLRLGAKTVFPFRSGVPRPDVAALHSDLPGAGASGFSLETGLPVGFHLATLEYCRAEADTWVEFNTFSLTVGLGPLVAAVEGAPTDPAQAEWQLRGWCFHPQVAVESLAVQFGRHRADMHYGGLRPDVAQDHPAMPTALYSGFSGRLPLGPGEGPVQLTARLANGSVLRQVVLPALSIPDHRLAAATLAAQQARAADIWLPVHAEPEVSLIIPVYNKLDLTLACLESLVRHAGPTN